MTSKTRDSIDLSAEALKLDNEQILEKINDKYENHPSVKDIKDRISESISFSFAKASVCDIIKIIKGLDPKSATGFDTIPPKLVILSSDAIAEPLTQLINVTTIDSHLFPTCEKVASVTPAFKKDDRLNKENYRPISVLNVFSKIFERFLLNKKYTIFR